MKAICNDNHTAGSFCALISLFVCLYLKLKWIQKAIAINRKEKHLRHLSFKNLPYDFLPLKAMISKVYSRNLLNKAFSIIMN